MINQQGTNETYAFQRSSRSIGALIVLGLCISGSGFLLKLQAPWFLLIPIALVAFEATIRVIRKLGYGMIIDSGGIAIADETGMHRYSANLVDHVSIGGGGRSVQLYLVDGDRVDVPPMACPPAEILKQQLDLRGFKVEAA